jgi:MFS family permease
MAWLVVALLWPVALLNYLDRQMLAAMKYSVMSDIPTIATEANWGFMLGQFKWVYAFLSPIGGYLADRVSRRFTICGSLFVWSVVTWWTGHVSTYDELLLARSLMGISEAFYIPAALALISDYHPGSTRSRAVALHQMAIYCGVIIGGFSGYIADSPELGWRVAFDTCGFVGMLYALPLVLLLRDAPRTFREAGAQQLSPAGALLALLSNGSFILLVLYFTLPALAGWVVRDWMPAILKQQFDIGQGVAGVSATLYWQVAAIGGAIGGGWLADSWMRRSNRGRIYVSAIGMSFIIPAMFGVGNAGSLSVAVAFLVLFGLGWGFFDCNNMPILCQIVRPELRATGYGIMNFVSISCGGLADWGFGELRDREVPLNMIFGVFAGAAVVSVVLVLLIRPKRELGEF